eukprot:GHVS01002960.1.p1 GENE.GHVS01002960.1~~GHVS01002960.1.p1  ORF type:complete len:2148 (+),score=158.90 GHVS01002960.1:1061-7504(+)
MHGPYSGDESAFIELIGVLPLRLHLGYGPTDGYTPTSTGLGARRQPDDDSYTVQLHVNHGLKSDVSTLRKAMKLEVMENKKKDKNDLEFTLEWKNNRIHLTSKSIVPGGKYRLHIDESKDVVDCFDMPLEKSTLKFEVSKRDYNFAVMQSTVFAGAAGDGGEISLVGFVTPLSGISDPTFISSEGRVSKLSDDNPTLGGLVKEYHKRFAYCRDPGYCHSGQRGPASRDVRLLDEILMQQAEAWKEGSETLDLLKKESPKAFEEVEFQLGEINNRLVSLDLRDVHSSFNEYQYYLYTRRSYYALYGIEKVGEDIKSIVVKLFDLKNGSVVVPKEAGLFMVHKGSVDRIVMLDIKQNAGSSIILTKPMEKEKQHSAIYLAMKFEGGGSDVFIVKPQESDDGLAQNEIKSDPIMGLAYAVVRTDRVAYMMGDTVSVTGWIMVNSASACDGTAGGEGDVCLLSEALHLSPESQQLHVSLSVRETMGSRISSTPVVFVVDEFGAFHGKLNLPNLLLLDPGDLKLYWVARIAVIQIDTPYMDEVDRTRYGMDYDRWGYRMSHNMDAPFTSGSDSNGSQSSRSFSAYSEVFEEASSLGGDLDGNDRKGEGDGDESEKWPSGEVGPVERKEGGGVRVDRKNYRPVERKEGGGARVDRKSYNLDYDPLGDRISSGSDAKHGSQSSRDSSAYPAVFNEDLDVNEDLTKVSSLGGELDGKHRKGKGAPRIIEDENSYSPDEESEQLLSEDVGPVERKEFGGVRFFAPLEFLRFEPEEGTIAPEEASRWTMLEVKGGPLLTGQWDRSNLMLSLDVSQAVDRRGHLTIDGRVLHNSGEVGKEQFAVSVKITSVTADIWRSNRRENVMDVLATSRGMSAYAELDYISFTVGLGSMQHITISFVFDTDLIGQLNQKIEIAKVLEDALSRKSRNMEPKELRGLVALRPDHFLVEVEVFGVGGETVSTRRKVFVSDLGHFVKQVAVYPPLLLPGVPTEAIVETSRAVPDSKSKDDITTEIFWFEVNPDKIERAESDMYKVGVDQNMCIDIKAEAVHKGIPVGEWSVTDRLVLSPVEDCNAKATLESQGIYSSLCKEIKVAAYVVVSRLSMKDDLQKGETSEPPRHAYGCQYLTPDSNVFNSRVVEVYVRTMNATYKVGETVKIKMVNIFGNQSSLNPVITKEGESISALLHTTWMVGFEKEQVTTRRVFETENTIIAEVGPVPNQCSSARECKLKIFMIPVLSEEPLKVFEKNWDALKKLNFVSKSGTFYVSEEIVVKVDSAPKEAAKTRKVEVDVEVKGPLNEAKTEFEPGTNAFVHVGVDVDDNEYEGQVTVYVVDKSVVDLMPHPSVSIYPDFNPAEDNPNRRITWGTTFSSFESLDNVDLRNEEIRKNSEQHGYVKMEFPPQKFQTQMIESHTWDWISAGPEWKPLLRSASEVADPFVHFEVIVLKNGRLTGVVKVPLPSYAGVFDVRAFVVMKKTAPNGLSQLRWGAGYALLVSSPQYMVGIYSPRFMRPLEETTIGVVLSTDWRPHDVIVGMTFGAVRFEGKMVEVSSRSREVLWTVDAPKDTEAELQFVIYDEEYHIDLIFKTLVEIRPLSQFSDIVSLYLLKTESATLHIEVPDIYADFGSIGFTCATSFEALQQWLYTRWQSEMKTLQSNGGYISGQDVLAVFYVFVHYGVLLVGNKDVSLSDYVDDKIGFLLAPWDKLKEMGHNNRCVDRRGNLKKEMDCCRIDLELTAGAVMVLRMAEDKDKYEKPIDTLLGAIGAELKEICETNSLLPREKTFAYMYYALGSNAFMNNICPKKNFQSIVDVCFGKTATVAQDLREACLWVAMGKTKEQQKNTSNTDETVFDHIKEFIASLNEKDHDLSIIEQTLVLRLTNPQSDDDAMITRYLGGQDASKRSVWTSTGLEFVETLETLRQLKEANPDVSVRIGLGKDNTELMNEKVPRFTEFTKHQTQKWPTVLEPRNAAGTSVAQLVVSFEGNDRGFLLLSMNYVLKETKKVSRGVEVTRKFLHYNNATGKCDDPEELSVVRGTFVCSVLEVQLADSLFDVEVIDAHPVGLEQTRNGYINLLDNIYMETPKWLLKSCVENKQRDRTRWRCQYLGGGQYTFTSVLSANRPGNYGCPPAIVRSQRNPDVMGSSNVLASGFVVVESDVKKGGPQ